MVLTSDAVYMCRKDILKDLARLEQLTARDSKIAELESEFALQTNQPVNDAVEVSVKNDSVYGQAADPSSATSDEGVCSEESLELCDDFEFLFKSLIELP